MRLPVAVVAVLAVVAFVFVFVFVATRRSVPVDVGAVSIASEVDDASSSSAVAIERPDGAGARRSEALRSDAHASESAAAIEALSVSVVGVDGLAPNSWQVGLRVVRPTPDDPSPTIRDVAGRARARSRPRSGYDLFLRGRSATPVGLPAEFLAGGLPIELTATAYAKSDSALLVSSPLFVDASTRGPITLVVAEPTRLVVRVEGARPVGALVYRVAPIDSSGAGEHVDETIETADSSALFHVEHGLAHAIRVRGGKSDDVVEARCAPLPRSASELVVVRFPGGLLDPPPAGYAEIALAGRIEGAKGPIDRIWAAVDDGLPTSILARADGTFEFVAPRGHEVVLHAASDGLEARFEPEVSRHPFVRDVVLRRLAPAPVVGLTLRTVAAESDEAVQPTNVTLVHRVGDREHKLLLGRIGADRVDVDVPALPGIEYLATAHDRRDDAGLLFADGPPSQPTGERLVRTIRLERGFRREFSVLDCALQTPVSGVEVVLDGRVVARGDGRVVVELSTWPARLDFTAPGFDGAYWPIQGSDSLTSRSVSICASD